MTEATQSGAASGRAQRSRAGSSLPPTATHPLLNLRRPFNSTIPGSSVGAVRKVAKLDSGTHIVAAREPGGTWYRLVKRTRFTRANARVLREAGISEVVLRRHTRRASFQLGWLSQRSD